MNSDKTQVVTKSSAVEIGTELNQTYKIDALIGVGGMGEVFKGHNIQTGDPVAIKVVLPEFARDEMIFELFRKEARVLNHLSHDAIVRYYVFSLDRAIGRPYLAMEYVDGLSLAAMIKDTPLAPESFFGLLRRLADGLQKAHEAGVIHRDISPDNVILPDGLVEKAKIIDFGIARSANVGGGTLLGGSFAGKYSYVSPEQLGLFGGEVTPKSDIYSLGLMMAAALRGQPINMSGSQVEVIEKRRSVPQLSGVGIPKQFHAVLTAMLQPNPADRPEDMAAVRDWNIDAKLPTPPKTKQPKAGAPSATQSARQTVGAQGQPKAQSSAFRNTAIGLGLVTVIGIGALGGWIYVQSQKPQTAGQQVFPTTPKEAVNLPAPETQKQPISTPEVPTPKDSERLPQQADETVPIKTQPAPPVQVPVADSTAVAPIPETIKTPAQTQVPPQPSIDATPPPAPPTKTPDTRVAVLPDVVKHPPPTNPPAGFDLVALRNYVQSYGGDSCFRANIDKLTANSAELSILGSQETSAQFEKLFADKAGFKPQIKLEALATPQCGFIGALNKVAPKNGAPLAIKLNRDQLRGSNSDTGVAGDSLKITVTGIADRNIYLFVVDHEGAIQNINRACPTCVTMKDGEMTAALSLFSPPETANTSAPPFYPMLVFVAAAGKPLNGINAQDAFDAADFTAPLLKDAASAEDFSMQLAYLKLTTK